MVKNKQGVRPIRIVKHTFHDSKPLSMEERVFLTLECGNLPTDRELEKSKKKSRKKKEAKVVEKGEENESESETSSES